MGWGLAWNFDLDVGFVGRRLPSEDPGEGMRHLHHRGDEEGEGEERSGRVSRRGGRLGREKGILGILDLHAPFLFNVRAPLPVRLFGRAFGLPIGAPESPCFGISDEYARYGHRELVRPFMALAQASLNATSSSVLREDRSIEIPSEQSLPNVPGNPCLEMGA
jgi:hypothetical protein